MADADMLRSLRERVIDATGADRDLNDEIAVATNQCQKRGYFLYEWSERGSTHNLFHSPPYTDSLDAAVLLVERCLPGWTIARISQDDHRDWHAELREGFLTSYSRVALSGSGLRGTTAPRAILTAMIAALLAQAEADAA